MEAKLAMRLLIVAGLLPLSACVEPFDQPGRWHPTLVNQANLDAETVDKADTVAGHGVPGSDAVLDEQAVQRLYEDRAKPLRSETTTLGGGSGGSGQ